MAACFSKMHLLFLVTLVLNLFSPAQATLGYLDEQCANAVKQDRKNRWCCSACNQDNPQACCRWSSTHRAHDKIQTFYYAWYASQPTDGYWRHWSANRRIGGGEYSPEFDDIASAHYPLLGPYSSTDFEVVQQHMKWLSEAGIGVMVYSWWGRDSFEEAVLMKYLNAALLFGIKIAFYMEPYGGGYIRKDSRGNWIGTLTPETARDDVKYLIDKYGCHCAMYRQNGRPLFLFFAARSYLSNTPDSGDMSEWREVWRDLHSNSRYNPIVITQDVTLENRIIAGDWDGGHDYSCDESLRQSSNWKSLAQQYEAAGKIFYFTVCPGKDKTRLSPGTETPIDRQNGAFYVDMWKKAMAAKQNSVNPVVISAFNEFHIGTMIEPVQAKSFASYTTMINGEMRTIDGYTYQDFNGSYGLTGMEASLAYIRKTRQLRDMYLPTTPIKVCYNYVRWICKCGQRTAAQLRNCSNFVANRNCIIPTGSRARTRYLNTLADSLINKCT